MERSTNALAELAEWMDGQIDAFPVMSNQFTEQDMRDRLNARKVQRIVAELAKVGVRKNDFSSDESDESDCILDLANAAIKCRAIAEEGATNV